MLVDLNISEIEQGILLRNSLPGIEMFDDLELFNNTVGEPYAALMKDGQLIVCVHHSVLAGREDAQSERLDVAANGKDGQLNDRQLRFCSEYIVDLNETKAAIRSGYSSKTACAQASRLLRNVKVQAEIERLKAKRAQKFDISVERVIQELASLGFTIQDGPQYRDAVRVKSLELLGKHLGMFDGVVPGRKDRLEELMKAKLAALESKPE